MPKIKSAFGQNLTVAEHSLVLAGAIAAAMAHGELVAFDYDGKERLVEAHAVGTSTKDGSLVLRAYQVAGESSRQTPHWALFTIDKIDRATFGTGLPGVSAAPRPGYSMGDKQMTTVLAEIDTSGT